MSLTTPVTRDSDAVFPGEGWFFYWKTSSSLWKSKIEELHEGSVLIVPINWAFHSEMGDDVDFAENRPETNLRKLVDIAMELKKEVVFLLPLTPAPFLSNGGVPHMLASNLAKGKNGLAYTVVDSDRGLNKLYSFFNPNIFKKWSLFVNKLSQYFSEQGIASDIKGLISGYYDGEEYRSYLEDVSSIFESSFSRFLMAKKEEFAQDEFQIKNREEEIILQREFTQTISDLYHGFATKSLSANWTGVIKAAFMGGPLDDNLARMMNSYNPIDYIQDTFQSISEGIVPSSVLLPTTTKRGAFAKIVSDLIDYNFKRDIYTTSYQDDDDGANLKKLGFFIIADEFDLVEGTSLWDRYHFWDYIHQEFRWSFERLSVSEMNFDEETMDFEKVHCFLGETLDETSFRKALKVFMLGGNVLLDRNNLEDKFIKKLEGFFIENSLQVERINFHTEVHNVTLGTGRLVVFDGSKLESLNSDKMLSFWERLFETFEFLYLPLHFDDDVEYFWRTRMSTPSELSYQEVRRLGVYNPSSYKKRVVVPHAKNFALKKVIDELDVQVQTKSNEIEIDMQPGGSVSLEFGVFT